MGKKYAWIAASCYVVLVAYSIIDRFILIDKYRYSSYVHVSISASTVIPWIIEFGLAVVLFIRNKKAIIVFSGATCLKYIYYLINDLSLFHLSRAVAYAALVMLIVIMIYANGVSSRIWFLPAMLLWIGLLVSWISYDYFYYLSTRWESVLYGVVECAAFIFAGLWIKCCDPPVEVSCDPPVEVSGIQAKGSIIGGADKLIIYKDLLDSGIITQDEFNEKKQQIMGS